MKSKTASLAAIIGSMIFAQPALAKWYEASSDHFVIYADDEEKDVREFAENLERYHAALKIVRKYGNKPAPSPSNRVTLYVTNSTDALSKLAQDKSGTIAGFYIPRAGASAAFTPPIKKSGERVAEFNQVVLLHEYAHHFMISNLPISLPSWYTEGFAEFVGTTTFGKDGSVGIGKPALHRVGELTYADPVPWKLLFDTSAYAEYRRKNKRGDSFYGQSWAVLHYLEFTEEGRPLHADFLKRLLAGESDIKAAENAFGDLNKFGKTIGRYIRQNKMSFLSLASKELVFQPVTLRALSAGEAAMMPVVMQSRRGVDEKLAATLVLTARQIAAAYPNDPAAQAALAEAEFDAGNDDAAIAAADKATAKQPNNINALLQKGYALLRKAPKSEDRDAAFAIVRKHMIGINKIEQKHPIPLIQFYKSFLDQGVEPNENAKSAVNSALQLSPFDKELRLMIAQQYVYDKRYSEALSHIKLLMNDPHRQETEGDTLSKLLEEVETNLGIKKAGADEKTGAGTSVSVPTPTAGDDKSAGSN